MAGELDPGGCSSADYFLPAELCFIPAFYVLSGFQGGLLYAKGNQIVYTVGSQRNRRTGILFVALP